MTIDTLRHYLTLGLAIHEKSILEEMLENWLETFVEDLDRDGITLATVDEGSALDMIIEKLIVTIASRRESVVHFKELKAQFMAELQRAKNQTEIELVMEEHLKDFSDGMMTFQADRKAFSRWLGPDAIQDRYDKRINVNEREIAVYLVRLGFVARQLIAIAVEEDDLKRCWRTMGIEKVLNDNRKCRMDPRVEMAEFRAISLPLRAMPGGLTSSILEPATLRFIYESAQNRTFDVWVQTEALSLLQVADPESFASISRRRFEEPGATSSDDLFVRHRIALLVGDAFRSMSGLKEIIEILPADKSPYVRQAAAKALAMNPDKETVAALATLAVGDEATQVRAAAYLAGLELLATTDWVESMLALLVRGIAQETDTFVLRTLCHCCRQGTSTLVDAESGPPSDWSQRIVEALDQLIDRTQSGEVRLWAHQSKEFVWSEADPIRREVKRRLSTRLKAIKRRTTGRVSKKLFQGLDDDTVGRILSVLVQDDFGLDVSPGWLGWQVGRDHHFGIRLWRVLYEVVHPSPEKRQAFPHTIGRKFWGEVRIPSASICELTRTKVPGEPLYFSGEGSWRPSLPLVDDLISALDLGAGKTVRFFTAEGIAELTTPGMAKRLIAYARLTVRFSKYSDSRNKKDGGKAYLDAIKTLGFRYVLKPHEDHGAQTAGDDPNRDDAMAQPAMLAVPMVALPLREFYRYFISIFENTIDHLIYFGIGITALFVGLHFWRNRQLKKARSRIPLVLGGWGTRGKSGTERLKAAVINALGYSYVSKTTGCEAMFLYAHPFGETKEYFLFRPYDKATIWEQQELIRTAADLESEVFLWECMGLSPEYVKILQSSWTKDDFSTITNTYPDHEDLQGPAGINLPDVMTQFIPKNGTLITSEEQMTPILRYDSEQKGTDFHRVGWLQAGLLTDDVLERFPYSEHPYNIALVMKLFNELGVDEDFALKEMADKVVPDLGVLKTFEPAPVRGRTLVFSNGMSANERMATMGNWARAGFADHDWINKPAERLVTVINNRADRIARSRAFASILVQDLDVDAHVLIGGNLKGLKSYIDDEWKTSLAQVSLWKEAAITNEEAVRVMHLHATKSRMPQSREQVEARAEAMLSELSDADRRGVLDNLFSNDMRRNHLAVWSSDRIEAFEHEFNRDLWVADRYQYIKKDALAASAADREKVEHDFKGLLDHWFREKFIVIDDYFASGDAVINTIVDSLPPGCTCKLMGMQNIKGTGLDFIYRWLAWDACFQMCSELERNDRESILNALDRLANYPELGVLSFDYILAKLVALEKRPIAQDMAVHIATEYTRSQIENVRAKYSFKTSKESVFNTISSWLIMRVEEVLDGFDAVRRRHRADRIYRDMVDERISRERAVSELKALTKRQKGGWLEGTVRGKK